MTLMINGLLWWIITWSDEKKKKKHNLSDTKIKELVSEVEVKKDRLFEV